MPTESPANATREKCNPVVEVPAKGRLAGAVIETHDPQQVIEDIRNQLAAKDNVLAFLFGTGTSSGIKIDGTGDSAGTKISLVPDLKGLTALCKAAVTAKGKPQAEAWPILEAQCEAEKMEANIENILSVVQSRVEAIGGKEMLSGLSGSQWAQLEAVIRETIAKAVQPGDKLVPTQLPQDDFARWVRQSNRGRPLEVFTLNYDVLIERAMEKAAVPLFDGFVGAYEPFFCPDSLERKELCPPPTWTRLWKIHGSVNWQARGGIGKGRVVRTQPTDTGEMILPSRRKYDESRKLPYTALLDQLCRTLDQSNSVLVTCGYSFGDYHVNSILLSVLDNRRLSHVVALMHGELSTRSRVVRIADGRRNFIVVGPNGGVIEGKWAPWRLVRPVDESTSAFMDLAFDSEAVKPDENKGAADPTSADLQGKVRLGSFADFCKFLLTICREENAPDGD